MKEVNTTVEAAAVRPENAELITKEDPHLAARMREWRHRIHAHPETAFEEVETAALVSNHLRELGLEVTSGIAETG